MNMRQPEYKEGNYVAKVVDQAFTETREKKKPMIVQRVTINNLLVDAGTKFEELQNLANHYERKIHLVINHDSDKAMEFLLKKLRYAGFEKPSFRDFNLAGSTVRCTCSHDLSSEYPENWDLMLPPRESTPLVHDPKLSKKMDALFGKALKEPITNSAESPIETDVEPPREDAPILPPDDEVPF